MNGALQSTDAFRHDIRQTLQAITLLVETLHDRVIDVRQTDIVEQIATTVRCAELMVNRFSDSVERAPELRAARMHVFRVDHLLAEISAEFAADAQARELSLECKLSPCTISGSRLLLAEMLRVLMGNAIRYTPCGFVRMVCGRTRDMVRISVVDSGMGISKAAQTLIAEEFYQPHDPSPDGHHPLGEGLAIVTRIARQLGYTLGLTSRVGQGSTFTISIPWAPQLPDGHQEKYADDDHH